MERSNTFLDDTTFSDDVKLTLTYVLHINIINSRRTTTLLDKAAIYSIGTQ